MFKADRQDIYGKYSAKVIRNAANDPFMTYKKLKHYGVELKQKTARSGTGIDEQTDLSRDEKIKISQKKFEILHGMTLSRPKQKLNEVSQSIKNVSAMLIKDDITKDVESEL